MALPLGNADPPFHLPFDIWSAAIVACEFEARPVECASRSGPWTCRLSLRDLLLCAGLVQSPASSARDLSAWGFLIEHAASVHPRAGRLRITDEVDTWYSRVKGLFAERIGLGLAAWLLWREFGVTHIADAGPFLSEIVLDPTSPYHQKGLALIGTHGELRPDLFCLTRGGEAVIAESKGAIGPPSAVPASERMRAKNQLNNVSLVGVATRATENRLAFSTNLRRVSDVAANSGTDTGVRVEDPEGDHESLAVPVTADRLVVDAYSKLLTFVGLGFVGFLLRRGARPLLPPQLQDLPSASARGEQIVVLAEVFGLRFGLPRAIAKAVLNEPEDGVALRVGHALDESPHSPIAARRTARWLLRLAEWLRRDSNLVLAPSPFAREPPGGDFQPPAGRDRQ